MLNAPSPSHYFSANHIQRLLSREPTDSFAIAGEIARTSANGSDALCQKASGTGLGDGQRGVPHLQVVSNDLFQRIAVIGKDQVIELLFNPFDKLINAFLSGLQGMRPAL